MSLGVALGNGRGYKRPDGALRFAVRSLPVQAVVLPRFTENFAGKLIAVRGTEFLLRRHQLLANADGRQLIAANAPVQNFLLSCFGVEKPRAAFIDQRYGSGPISCTDI